MVVVLLVFLLASCVCVQSDDPGIRLFVSPHLFPPSIQNKAAEAFNLLVSFAISEESTTPWWSPSHTVLFKSVKVNALHLTTGALSVSTEGLQFQTHDLGGNITFSVLYGPKNTSATGVAVFNSSSFKIVFQVNSAGGHPILKVPTLAINVVPAHIFLPHKLPNAVQKEIIATFSSFVTTNLTNSAKAKLPLTLQGLIGFEFGSGVKSVAWGNLTVNIDYSLTNDVVFTDDQMILDIKGAITVANANVPICPISSDNIPSNYTGPNAIALGLDASVIECVFWQGKDPNVVKNLLANLLPFQFDNRVSLLVGVLGSPSLDFENPNSLLQMVELGLLVPIARADLNETFISFTTNVTVGVDITVNMTAPSAEIVISNITISDLALKSKNTKYIPPVFEKQLAKQSWGDFEKMLNGRLAGLPAIKVSAPLPEGLLSLIRNLTFKTGEKYALVSFDLE